MAHEVKKMVYAYVEGSTDPMYRHPWHKSMTQDDSMPIAPDTPVMVAAEKCDVLFKTVKVPNYALIDGRYVETGTHSIAREDDLTVLEARIGSKGWQDHQNIPILEYCADLVDSHKDKFELNTMGNLADSKIMFVNLMIKDSYINILGGDEMHQNFLITNYHMWGKAADTRRTPIRAVCRNTVEYGQQFGKETALKFSHFKPWSTEEIDAMLKLADEELNGFKEAAEYLASKRFSVESLKDYYSKVFPSTAKQPSVADQVEAGNFVVVEPELSRQAKKAYQSVDTQPGNQFATGSWWQAYNAATYTVDHLAGRTRDSRMKSAMYGPGRNAKARALDLALDFANAA